MRKLAAATVLTAALLLPATPAGASTNSKQTVTTVTIKVKVKDLSGGAATAQGTTANTEAGCASVSVTETAYDVIGLKLFSSELTDTNWCWGWTSLTSGEVLTTIPHASVKQWHMTGESYCGQISFTSNPFLGDGWVSTSEQAFSFMGSCSAGLAYDDFTDILLAPDGQYATGGSIPFD